MLQYLKQKSFLHALDPRIKLALLILLNVALFATNMLGAISFLLVLIFAFYLLARISPIQGAGELGAVWLFVLLPLLFALLGGEALDAAIRATLRLVTVSMSAVLFIYTTRQRDIASALVFFKVPATLALMLTMAFRFVPVFQDEVQRVQAAQMARGYTRSWLVFPILVPVLHRAFARARALGMSMDARGFEPGRGII
ncbi:Energy-coupling factor transporter transmembrane protein EcfT [Candidatus Burarchaeum australiense]|nr:Energy-coupling factor transporter transmembrane protein EcfT [Candidatus Burarchaeum australiense]